MATRPRFSATAFRLWNVAQWTAVAATVVLLVGLVARPTLALGVLWNLVIPLVPATLLLSPAIWRNVCPLATLEILGNWRGKAWQLPKATAHRYWTLGILLLLLLVPARRFLFNTNGPALAVTVGVVAVAAVILGRYFDLKAGFCNAICPVLPVERLYGQAPLLTIGNPRCLPCTRCTQSGCLDSSATKSIGQVLGPSQAGGAWLRSVFGAFAAAFPGFVIGYHTIDDGRLVTAGLTYLHVLGWMAASYLAAVALVGLLRISALRAILLLAGASAGLYYWFASRTIANALGLAPVGAPALRMVFLSLVGFWLWRAGAFRRPQVPPSQRLTRSAPTAAV